MNEQTAQVLKQIADKIDVPVQQLWAGLIAYAPFTFWTWVAGIALGLVMTVLFAILTVWCVKKESESVLAAAFFTGITLGLTGLLGFIHMSDALAAKYAPEAWAAQKILRVVR
jgi:hypothetical protein